MSYTKSMDLLNVLLNTMTSDSSVQSLAEKTGGTTEQVQSTVAQAIPVLLQSMTNNASTKKGAESLLEALTQHTSKDSMQSQIENADETDGNAIIKHILGSNAKSVVSALAKESGMKTTQVNSLLGSIAPALLSGLSAATKAASKSKSAGTDLTSLIKLFGGSSSKSSSNLSGALLSSLLSSKGGSSLVGSLIGAGAKKAVSNAAGNAAGSLIGSLLGGGSAKKSDTSSFDGSALLGALLGAM